MRSPETKTYFPPFELSKPMVSHGIACVLKSDAEGYHEGDIIAGPISIAQYSTRVIEANTDIRKVNTVSGAPDVRDNIGALGMPGLTAYASLYEIGKSKKCETIFISSSSAAGAAGQIVGQIAKREGLKVIGSVGSDDKLNLILNELSFDMRSSRVPRYASPTVNTTPKDQSPGRSLTILLWVVTCLGSLQQPDQQIL
jgi:NADPH-dependent curcumin reductase CurA